MGPRTLITGSFGKSLGEFLQALVDHLIWFTGIWYKGTMKKSEKIKGKEAVAARKKLQLGYGIFVAAGIIIVAILVFMMFNPFIAKNGDKVSVFYTGTLDNGTIFDTNINATPLVFTLGKEMVFPGFEEAILGMGVNDTRTVTIPPDRAYGFYNSSLVHILNRSALPANMTPLVGEYYTIRRTTDGAVSMVKIINVTPTTITWDENNALVGENLTFTLRLVSINRE
jgi:peptidylprolyl isomerase